MQPWYCRPNIFRRAAAGPPLVAPICIHIGFFARGTIRLEEAELAGDGTDARISKVATRCASESDGSPGEIREKQDFTRDVPQTQIQRRRFTTPGRSEQTHARSENDSTMASVASVEPSETTRISINSAG